MKLFILVIFSCFLLSGSLFGAQQPKTEKVLSNQQKNNAEPQQQPTPEEIKQREKNAEEYARLVSALGGKMLKANL